VPTFELSFPNWPPGGRPQVLASWTMKKAKGAPDKSLSAAAFFNGAKPRWTLDAAKNGGQSAEFDIRRLWDKAKRKLTLEIRSVARKDGAQSLSKAELGALDVELGTMDDDEFSPGGDYPFTRKYYEKQGLLAVELTVDDPDFDLNEAAFGLTWRSNWEKDGFHLAKALDVKSTDEEKPAG
jgi:hypothetical protein